jgi:hypothetical protein
MKASYVLVAALLVVPAAASAQSEGVRGTWSASFTAGAGIPAGGEFHEGGNGTVLGLPTAVQSKTYGDVYDAGFGWRAGVGYGASRRVEIIADFAWSKKSASELSVGDVAGLDLRARFADYQSYGVEAGMRYHFAPDAAATPYVSLVGGFRWVDAIPGTFSVPAAGVTLPNTPFYDDSLVPVVGGDVGMLFAVSPRIKLGIEGGLRYHPDLSELATLAGTGLENLNDAGTNWSVPISGVVRLGF